LAADLEAVNEALSGVLDPCSIAMGRPTDIATMGLVERVEVAGDRVEVELLLTDPSCVHFASLRRYVSDAVGEVEGVAEVDVSVCTDQLWTPDRDRGRAASAPR
jgi:metal-sulfur cluster biosynthetic enzyme